MIAAARAWLPTGTFTAQTLGPTFSAVFAQWSSEWLAKAHIQLTCVQHGRGPRPVAIGALTIRKPGSTSTAEITARGKRLLIEAALAVDLTGVTLGDADRALLDAFVAGVAEDLLGRLDGGGGDGEPPAQEIGMVLSLGAADVLTLYCPQQLVISRYKSAQRPAERATATLTSRWQAVGSTAVTIEGVLGRASLPVEDLRELAMGDVLVLDTMIGGPVELRIAAAGRLAAGRLGSDLGRPAVHL